MSDNSTVVAGAPEPKVREMSRDELPNLSQCSPRNCPLDLPAAAVRARCLRERVGWIAEMGDYPAGSALCDLVWPTAARHGAGFLRRLTEFVLWLLGRRRKGPLRVELLDLAVAPGPSRIEVERALLGRLVEELHRSWGRALLVVPESSVTAQLFLRHARYRAIRVLHGYYGNEDGYVMAQGQN
jgi:ribosomal protein S18 acetylase RimI-like enzyme